MVNVEELLKPVSADQPCGPDLSYDPRLEELETILKGKPEIEIGEVKKPAEPPDWRDLQTKSVEFLAKSKHLRVATLLCCSLLKTGGLPGFRDGLQVLRGLLERYWGAVYPLLDPEDNNDPTQRLNLLSALLAPRGSVSGWLTILDYLYSAPLCQPKGLPAVTFEQLEAAKVGTPATEGAPAAGPTLDSLAAALRDNPDQVAANHKVLQEALEAAQGIDQFLTNTLSAGSTISFEELTKSLRTMLDGLQAYLPGAAGSEGAAGLEGQAPAGAPAAISISGTIRSRNDVVRALDSICKYYDQVEPGSPVPFLLRRAQKLATMNFVQAMQELNLATPDALRPSMGSAVEPPSS